ncbi:hypothetical protein IKG28_03435 [Candidatus Saccharibacteria bacterium]|nr:hypothetical protein [Candidatus Saccharibacteria bacterium]MBR3332652.1 hypothetical protein [Candidatus Saccharibacteria bacterium]
MAETNKKGGAGKFFLGAAIGAAAAAVAAKFIGSKKKACECDEDCKCGDDCKCEDKKTEKKEKSAK